jgi:hypothetical protein
MSADTRTKASKEERSARMKKAWETRRAKMQAAKGGASSQALAPEQGKEISFQIPSARTQQELIKVMIDQFFEYLEFALGNQDAGILRTGRFKILMENVKNHLAKTR